MHYLYMHGLEIFQISARPDYRYMYLKISTLYIYHTLKYDVSIIQPWDTVDRLNKEKTYNFAC